MVHLKKSTRRLPRRAASLVLIAAAGIGSQMMIAPASQASDPEGVVKAESTQKMSEATLDSTQNGTYDEGDQVTLTCYTHGQAVTGYYSSSFSSGYDDVWYLDDAGNYVPDVDMDTGSNDPVTAPCDSDTGGASDEAVDGFVDQWNGQYADFDGAYGAQCVDLFNFYNQDVVGAGFASVDYAYQLYDTHDSAKYTQVDASSTPEKGDVAIWSADLPGSGGAGHVAIVLGSSGSDLSVLTQNPGATNVTTLSTDYLLGYLRPVE